MKHSANYRYVAMLVTHTRTDRMGWKKHEYSESSVQISEAQEVSISMESVYVSEQIVLASLNMDRPSLARLSQCN
jgi:hypothetical protein